MKMNSEKTLVVTVLLSLTAWSLGEGLEINIKERLKKRMNKMSKKIIKKKGLIIYEGELEEIDPIKSKLDMSISKFSFTLFKNLIESRTVDNKLTKNVLVSTASAYRAFLEIYLGAEGQTKKELAKALRIEYDYEKLLGMFQDMRSSFVLDFFDMYRLVINTTYPIHSDIQKLLGEDLLMSRISSTITMNYLNRMAQETAKKKALKIYSEKFSRDLTFIMTTMTAFRVIWNIPFPTENSDRQIFHYDKKNGIPCRLMNTIGRFLYYRSDAMMAEVVGLESNESPLTLYIFVPLRDQTIHNMTQTMKLKHIMKAIDDSTEKLLEIYLPSFTLSEKVDLIPCLKEMNVTSLFDPELADLSGFSDHSGLSLGHATQNTLIEVDEGIVDENGKPIKANLQRGSSEEKGEVELRVYANGPFVYVLYDDASDYPVMMGVLMKPDRVRVV